MTIDPDSPARYTAGISGAIVGIDGGTALLVAAGDAARLVSLESDNASLAFEVADGLRAQRLNEARLRFATEPAAIGIWEVSLPDRVLTATPTMNAIYGMPPGPLPDFAAMRALIHVDDIAMTNAAFERAVTDEVPTPSSTASGAATRPDGSKSAARSGATSTVATDGARRAATLTQRLLAFSRQQPLQPEPVDVNRLVAGMSDLLRGSLGGGIQLETVLAGGLWPVCVDPNQLENVILNLGINGRDAMAGEGRVTIETHNCHLDDRYVAAEIGIAAGQYVLIAVSDAGAGMPPEVVAKAFDPFFTTKGVGKGTGLGLSQVYGFVRQSGGHVKIYSEVGVGTSVKLYLPRLTGELPASVAGPDAAPVGGDARELILVVEDEAGVRTVTVECLRELGYRVIEADNAVAALAAIEANPAIDLLFTDIVMPEVNGARLAAAARALRPGLKVLFTTGYTRNAVVHNGVVDPGVALIGKPFTFEALAANVRSVLDGS